MRGITFYPLNLSSVPREANTLHYFNQLSLIYCFQLDAGKQRHWQKIRGKKESKAEAFTWLPHYPPVQFCIGWQYLSPKVHGSYWVALSVQLFFWFLITTFSTWISAVGMISTPACHQCLSITLFFPSIMFNLVIQLFCQYPLKQAVIVYHLFLWEVWLIKRESE